MGNFSGKVNEKEFDLDAEISLSYLASPENVFKLRLRNVQISEKNGDLQLGTGINFRPEEKGNNSYREVWEKMLDLRAPYNGQAQAQGKFSLIVNVLGLAQLKGHELKKVEKLSFTTCGFLSSAGEARIKKMCDDYTQAVKLSLD